MLKQRLVGAVVLIALGVIFIPMLLTGEGNFLSGEMESNVPPKPMYELKAPKVTPLEIPANKAATKSSEPVMEPVPAQAANDATTSDNNAGVNTKAQSDNKPDTGATANSEAKPAQTSAMDTPAKDSNTAAKETVEKEATVNETAEKQSSSQSSEASNQEPVAETKPAVKTPPKPKPVTKPIVSGWAVQLGSFSVQKNALKLRDRLRKKGHASFVEEYTRAGKTHYRVRVGPELTRELATELEKKLKAETKIDGFVVSFPDK